MTAVELMVVVTILGVLAAIAVPAMKTSSYGGGVPGYAQRVDAVIDEARMRAVASRRWQRLAIWDNRVVLEQATREGMDTPDDWEEVRLLLAPGSAEIVALGPATTLDPGTSPKQGDGLGKALLFSPDGSASPGTIFLQRPNGDDAMRITVVRATSVSYVLNGW
jgi:Tfp pilus assembly protein FimT